MDITSGYGGVCVGGDCGHVGVEGVGVPLMLTLGDLEEFDEKKNQ